MKNYLDYFIPKYQNAPGELPEIKEKNGIYYINGRVVGEKPLSAKDPLLSLWVEGAALGKPLEWIGRGLQAGTKFVAPKTTKAIAESIGKAFSKFKKPSHINQDLTDNFLKFVNLNPEVKGLSLTDDVISYLPNDEKLLLKELQNSGVDISKLTREHLTGALNKRAKLLYETAPISRYALIFPKQTGGHQTVIYNKPQRFYVGKMNTSVEGGLEVPELYESYELGTKVGRDLYDATLRAIEAEGGNGVKSGGNLLNAQATTNTWKHFPDKRLIDNSGVHRYMKTDAEGKQVVDKVLFRQPVYKLTKPSGTELPAKSIIFDPKIIDNRGVMRIDWTDPNVLHGILPITSLWTGYSINKKENSQKTN